MPQDLPDDILIELVEVHLSDASNAQLRDALCNLSLTSRRFRSFAIPVLYHSLSFRIDHPRIRTFQDKITSMIRNHTRTKHLIQSRHLLRNVQRLSLLYWGGNFLPPPSADGLRLVAGDVEKLRVVIYDNLTRLVPHMSRLRELRLVMCVMTPFLYAAISACPLDLIHMRMDSPAGPIHIITDLPPKFHVTNLHYSYARQTWISSGRDDGNISDPYVARILEHSISSLKELSLDCGLLPTFASYVSDQTLSLQYLSVSFHLRQIHGPVLAGWQVSAAQSLWNILLASPQLRTLIINGIFPEILPPQDFDHHILPKLVEVSASPYVPWLLPMLTQGRKLQGVHTSHCFNVNGQPITQLVQCSPIHLRQLTMTGAVAQTVPELLDFIQSLSVFNHLEYLEITYIIDFHLWVGYDDVSISNTITNLLQDLKCLHVCHIWDMTDYRVHSGPPIFVDPQLLGHPSLKVLGIDFFTKNVWCWDIGVGWVQSEWKPTQEWYHRSPFSKCNNS